MGEVGREVLAAAALAWVRERAAAVGLEPDAVTVRPVLNWGGFVNTSFHVTDGAVRRHLKLTAAAEARGIVRWAGVHERLSACYRAPRMLEYGPMPAVDGYAALFEHVEGKSPRDLSAIEPEILALLGALHADRVLAETLAPAVENTESCLSCYLENHDRRFRDDLAGIQAALPPFVTASDVAWMWEEVERLAAGTRAAAAFQESMESPVHGDLWIDNVLVSATGAWHVLDWDDLRIGDPVLDYATVLGPTPSDLRPVEERALEGTVRIDLAQRERLRFYARATLLDWVVDPLSDWIDADAAGDDAVRMRTEKERVHRAAKALYLDLYDG